MNRLEESVLYWTYEADTHCDYCARKAWGSAALDAGLADDADYPEDSEGNYVHPVFTRRTHPDRLSCGSCFKIIDREGYERRLDDFIDTARRGSRHPYAQDFNDPDLAPAGFESEVRENVEFILAHYQEGDASDILDAALDEAGDTWAEQTLRLNAESEAATYDGDLFTRSV